MWYRCATGSYDRTARIWNVENGIETACLTGHENAVFSIGYNYPKWLDKVYFLKHSLRAYRHSAQSNNLYYVEGRIGVK